MGTTCTMRPPHGTSMEQFFIDQGVLRWRDDAPNTYRVVASGYKMPVFYAAVEKINKETGQRDVWAAVIKVSWYKDEICYKDMSEDMGPLYYDCPEKVLKRLTPTDCVESNAWRKKCWEKVRARKRKILPGSVLQYGNEKYHVVEKLRGGHLRVKDEFGTPYRMKASQVREADLLDL